MNNYNHLDLDKVKDLVCQYTSIKQASDYIQNEEIIFNPLVIKSKLKDSEEALNLLKKDLDEYHTAYLLSDDDTIKEKAKLLSSTLDYIYKLDIIQREKKWN